MADTTLVITGMIGSERYEVRCGDSGMEGPEPIVSFLEGELGEQGYSPDRIREVAPALTRLFGNTLRLYEEDEKPLAPAPGEAGALQTAPPAPLPGEVAIPQTPTGAPTAGDQAALIHTDPGTTAGPEAGGPTPEPHPGEDPVPDPQPDPTPEIDDQPAPGV